MQDDVLRVLPFIVQEIDCLTTICNSLQVCKSWRSCLADCSSCADLLLFIKVAAGLHEAAQAAQWMQSHGHLLRGLHVYCHEQGEAAHLAAAAAESLITQSCQLAAANQKPLRLIEVAKSGLYTAAFLKSLPAANLTSVNLQWLYPNEICMRALTESLGDFSNVREVALGFVGASGEGAIPASCFSGLKQLTKLTCLHWDSDGDEHGDGDGYPWGVGVEQHFPVQLRSISACTMEGPLGDMHHLTSLTYMDVDAEQLSLTHPPSQLQSLIVATYGQCLLDLSALTSLSNLSICALEGFAPGSSLPDKLQSLFFQATPLPQNIPTMFSGVAQMALRQIPTQPASLWKQLGSLSALQELYLVYHSLPSAAAAAAWGQLPSLHTLYICSFEPDDEEDGLEIDGDVGDEEGQDGMRAVIDGLGSAQSLEVLHLSMLGSGLPCGMQIGNLTRLRTLELSTSPAEDQDLLHLTKLCQLTELKLVYVGLDDAVWSSLACSLPQLVSLVVVGCSLGDVVIQVIAQQLKSLRHLCLESVISISDASVPSLLQLTQLSSLVLRDTALSLAEWAQLTAVIPCNAYDEVCKGTGAGP